MLLPLPENESKMKSDRHVEYTIELSEEAYDDLVNIRIIPTRNSVKTMASIAGSIYPQLSPALAKN